MLFFSTLSRPGLWMHREFLIQFPDAASSDKTVPQARTDWNRKRMKIRKIQVGVTLAKLLND